MKSRAHPPEKIMLGALADLFVRDIAELERTKQRGGKAVCRKLKRAVRELCGQGKLSK
jgi:hypothetical protein